MKMAGKVIPDVTLASADPQLLLCWEEKVRLGAECSLLLKHSKGKIVTILKSSSLTSLKPKISSSLPIIPPKAGKKKKKTRNKKKRLESLLTYHQRLVTEKGMPPSRLMLQHAAAPPAQPVNTKQNEKELLTCNYCEYSTPSKLGLVGHIGIRHKEVSQSPAIFRCTFCREQFDSNVRFRDHTRFDFTMEKLVKCPLCDCYPDNCYSHKEHMKEKHQRDRLFTAKEYSK